MKKLYHRRLSLTHFHQTCVISSATVIMILLLLAGCWFPKSAPNTVLDRSTIDRYRDTTVLNLTEVAAIKLPIKHGVKIWNPSVIRQGPAGRIFAANHTGEIYSLLDSDGDGLEDEAKLFCDVKEDKFKSPTGMAFNGWDMYVGLPQEIRIYQDLDHDFRADTSFSFFTDIPFSEHPYEFTSALNFDSEGYLICALATDSWNPGASPDPKRYRGAILRISPDGDSVQVLATGIRSVHDLALTKSGDIFFVDNQGGQNPTEELNLLKPGFFYGHNPEKYDHPAVEKPLLDLSTEVAPAGLCWSNANTQELYVAFYGPGEYWQRGAIAKIVLNRDENGNYAAEEIPVIKQLPKCSGLAFNNRGDLYVSLVGKTDYWYQPTDSIDGAIYRIVSAPWIPAKTSEENEDLTELTEDKLKQGEQLFKERACSACHALDGITELIGPNLKNISRVYNAEELLDEINFPSKRIKPGDFATKITTVNGMVYLGRLVSQNTREIQLMMVGNQVKHIAIEDILSKETHPTSLMYEGLLAGLEEQQIDALLTYLAAN